MEKERRRDATWREEEKERKYKREIKRDIYREWKEVKKDAAKRG